jgi:hypothetical protein
MKSKKSVIRNLREVLAGGFIMASAWPAGAVLIEALDFTGGGSAWTIQVPDPGTPNPYPATFELDGDPTKYGYENNTTDLGYVQMYQVVSAPPGSTMSNIRLDGNVSGFSSWNMVGRFGFGISPDFCTACAPYWTGIDHAGGVTQTDLPLTLDASGDPLFTGVTNVVILTEVWKGLNGVYQRPDVSDLRLYADLVSTSDLPVISSVTVNDLEGFAFTGEVGRLYTLQFSEGPGTTNWMDFDGMIRGTGGESLAFDPAGVSPQREYRIVPGDYEIFEDVTEATGLHGLGNVAGWGEYPGFACGWGDYNKDGYVDFYCGGIWQNNGGAGFTKVPVVPASAGLNGIWGDYDNDGFLDLYTWNKAVLPVVIGRLLHNVNGTHFVDVSGASLPVLPMNSPAPGCWGDFDSDGDLDLYLGGGESPGYQPDAFLWNNGSGVFTADTKATARPARGVTAADFDQDNDLDVYVSNYRLEPNILWRNDGTQSFSDQAATYQVSGGVFPAAHTIGSSWADMDNDGLFDLFVGNFSHPGQQPAKFLKNLGPGGSYHFQDMSATAGLAWRESFASPALGDFDGDTDLDLFFTSVYSGDESVLMRNEGNWVFTEISSENLLVFANTQCAWADYDNDGDLDLLSGNRLLRNRGNAYHWVRVHLVGNGTTVNTAAIGAKVLIDLGGGVKLIRQVEGATGEGNQNEQTLHFGLGTQAGNVNLNITWPDGSTQVVNAAVDQLVTVAQ